MIFSELHLVLVFHWLHPRPHQTQPSPSRCPCTAVPRATVASTSDKNSTTLDSSHDLSLSYEQDQKCCEVWLRHLAHSVRVGVPTVESQLRVWRSKWWRKLLTPEYSASEVALLAHGRSWDACKAIRAVLLGRLSFEQPSERLAARQLLDDAIRVACAEESQRGICLAVGSPSLTMDFLGFLVVQMALLSSH